MIPKGKLLIIGGHEDKGNEIVGENLNIHPKMEIVSHFEILGSLISKIPRAHHLIEIIAAASAISSEMEALYIASYRKAGFTHVGIIKVNDAHDAADPVLIKRIQGAHAVFFTGGDQSKLVSLLEGTDLLKAIQKKYLDDAHFIVGGTSAGAMAMPEIIITGGMIREALFKDDIEINKGLGLIKDIIVDTHFIKRGRIARLVHAIALNPDCLGIGLGENTALLISDGNVAECLGTGMVIMVDGTKIGKTNIGKAINNTPIFIEKIQLSIIAEGNSYLLKERKLLV